eukprot:TRINITY_DN5201_c0_g1_i2.p1 TRINITY_DN5201_c0_g1~~TRINITY_DN5201_c0_g1_i2.p1  ORF type:complete len:440 (-),score=117.65 TRINITY_DN5201_c0_g1_i2:80-1399(-)
MQLLVNWSDSIAYDVDTLFAVFFNSVFPKQFKDPVFAFQMLSFCRRNGVALLERKFFVTYFPTLFKLLAWHGDLVLTEFKVVFSLMVPRLLNVQLLHVILDLPLVAALLEHEANFCHLEFLVQDETVQNTLRHVLRNESSETNLKYSHLQHLFKALRVHHISRRVNDVASAVVPLLFCFFNVLLRSASEPSEELLNAVFHRFSPNLLFPIAGFQRRVQHTFVNRLLVIFESTPNLIFSLKRRIIVFIRMNTEAGQVTSLELLIAVVWAVGEYARADSDANLSALDDYLEALETYVQERIIDASQQGALPSVAAAADAVGTRALLVVVSALSKLAARWQSLASRATMCLCKLAQFARAFHPVVGRRANECIAILAHPSIASAVLCAPRRLPACHNSSGSGSAAAFIDDNSALPFVMQPVAESPRTPADTLVFHKLLCGAI